MSTQTIGYGAVFADCATSMGTYVAWAQVTDVSVPAQKVKKIDVSNIGMASRSMLYIPGLADGDEVEITQIYDHTEAARIAALRGTAGHFFKATDPNTTNTVSFSGFISEGPSWNYKSNDLAEMKTKIVVSGDITLA